MKQNTDKLMEILDYTVFTSVRSGLNRDPQTPQGLDDLKWVSNSATLIYGKKDAVLVDTFLTIEQNHILIDSIKETGKNLKYIFITHPHGDHFFGLSLLLESFPNAVALASSAVTKGCAEHIQPEWVANFWEPRYPGQIPKSLVIPDALDNNEFELEGERLLVLDAGFTDTHVSTVLYAPSIALIVGGDVVYNGIHIYLGETTLDTRQDWKNFLTMLINLSPKSVVAGHKQPHLPDDPAILEQTKKYLDDFDRLNAETSTTIELYTVMLAIYSNYVNPGSLWGGALAAKSIKK
jgi:glyoxylase-like metal-dependent hydrolase (beta-lactamase superfamily II)